MRLGTATWSCVFVGNQMAMVPDELSRDLQITACRLHLEERDEMHFQSDFFEGRVQTDWRSHSLGTLSGVLFKSVVDTDLGPCAVNFLLNYRILDAGKAALKEYEEEFSEISYRLAVEQSRIPKALRTYLDNRGGARRQ